MQQRRDCDALVLFGATGDLCYRKIYPALYHLVRRGHLNMPSIGVARAGWNRRAAHRAGPRKRADVRQADRDEEVLASASSSLLRYVDGDYTQRVDVRRTAQGRSAMRSGRCTISPFRRACFRS